MNINEIDGSNNKTNAGNNNSIAEYNKPIGEKILPEWVYWVWLIAIISLVFSIITLFIDVIPHTDWNIEVVSLSIVLGFVGILSTFIVVGNYSHVKEIERKFDKKTKEIEDLRSELDDVKIKIETAKSEITKFYDWRNSVFDEDIKCIKESLLKLMFRENQ
jgi:uncharacterized membrane protein (DUF485 family)